MLSWRKSADAYPAVSHLANNVAFGLNNLGDFLNANGRPAEAVEALSRARPIVQKLSEFESAGAPLLRAHCHRFLLLLPGELAERSLLVEGHAASVAGGAAYHSEARDIMAAGRPFDPRETDGPRSASITIVHRSVRPSLVMGRLWRRSGNLVG